MRHPFLLAAAAALFSTSIHAAGPFSPAPGQAGSNAVGMASATITNWATGYANYLPGADLTATFQTPAKALGQALGTIDDIVSLGNGGSIVLTFGGSIVNGAGADFAVFENSFGDNFLELARVEVSSNGSNFFRFPAYSLTPGPVGAFEQSMDPTNLGGLPVPGTNFTSFYEGFAGKYRAGFGTPFDLSALSGIAVSNPSLDLNNVRYVRIVDVLGNGSEFDDCLTSDPCTPNRIYDPYKTVESAGFDLEAVGVMHFAAAAPVPEPEQFALFGAGAALLLHVLRRRQRGIAATSCATNFS